MIELILFIALGVFIYLSLYFRDKHKGDKVTEETQEPTTTTETREESDECCGQHLVCEKDSLLNTDAQIEYYDDEELDILSGVHPDNFSEEEYQMVRDIFNSLQEKDVAGWVRSLQMRNIQLPTDIREEALLIIRERRNKTKA